MCGVFGVVRAGGVVADAAGFERAIRTLMRLSARRGRDAAGLALVLPEEVLVHRRAGSPERLLADPRFGRFLAPACARLAGATAGVAFLGHCRLVTHGSQAVAGHNQPVEVGDALVGVHNGIVTNVGRWADDERAREGRQVETELDSALLFRRIARARSERAPLDATAEAYGELEGEASIAFFDADAGALVLATNTGSLFVADACDAGVLAFASERDILARFLDDGALLPRESPIVALRAGESLAIALEDLAVTRGVLRPERAASTPPATAQATRTRRPVRAHDDRPPLRRCTRCILPSTYPFLDFDADGVCSECRAFQPQRFRGRVALEAELAKHRRSDGRPDCIVALSGGRDSSYGLHLLKRELGMTPLAFTYDWGLVTDIARRNQARMCGALGVEHVIRAADLEAQRRYIRKNLHAWLAKPDLGMLPILMAGDKFFYAHARALRRETGISLVVFCAGNELERTSFKAGFAGVRENNYKNRLFGLETTKKVQLAGYYAGQFLRNPRYFNESLLNGVRSFRATFVDVDDFLYLYDYEPWDERTIDETLMSRYGWERSPFTENTWRIGDGYTAFINYVYFRVAGFSEFDCFRSQEVRAGLRTREEALRLAALDNVPRMDELRDFARLVGFNLEEVLGRIDEIPPLTGDG
jgi:asparagine synthetase B (glutamine-hydrolysing)